MLRVLTFLVAGFVGSTYCAVASLQPYNNTALLMFLTEDHNQDGVITIDEVEQTFDRYDRNGNGVESRHEYTEYICEVNPDLYNLSHYLYDEYDVDGDHHLEKHDYDAFFHRMDLDGDGQVSVEEFIDFWVKIFEKYENMEAHGQIHEHGHSKCH